MEGCFLCLKNHKGNVGYIQVNSAHWLEFNIHNIIEMHLWPIEKIGASSFLCTFCWEELYDFHKFFMAIKAAQTRRYEIDIEPHCLQISKQSIVSLNEDAVKLERLTNKSPIMEFHYEPQILTQQALPTVILRKCTSAEIIEELTIADVKLEEDVSVYNSSMRTTSSQENFHHTDFRRVHTDEDTDSIATEINESNMLFNPIENLEVQAKDNRHEIMQNTKTSDEQRSILIIDFQSPKAEKEDDILEEMFIRRANSSPSSNQHTVKPSGKRGRPRKSISNTLQRKEIEAKPPETENNSFISIQQDDEYEEEISTKKKKRGRPKKSQKILEQKKKMLFSHMTARPARKRKLPRKYLTYDVESTDDKIKQKISKGLYLCMKSGKRGRPRKILINSMHSSNAPFEQTLPASEFIGPQLQQLEQLCDDNTPKISKGKRGRPRKYFTKDIVVGPQEFRSDMPSTSTGKRGRPRKFFTNDNISTEIPIEQIVKSENSIPYIVNHPRVKTKLKKRKRCRPYKELMRNYIATSVRCMQLFKSKNGARCESENSCMV